MDMKINQKLCFMTGRFASFIVKISVIYKLHLLFFNDQCTKSIDSFLLKLLVDYSYSHFSFRVCFKNGIFRKLEINQISLSEKNIKLCIIATALIHQGTKFMMLSMKWFSFWCLFLGSRFLFVVALSSSRRFQDKYKKTNLHIIYF